VRAVLRVVTSRHQASFSECLNVLLQDFCCQVLMHDVFSLSTYLLHFVIIINKYFNGVMLVAKQLP